MDESTWLTTTDNPIPLLRFMQRRASWPRRVRFICRCWELVEDLLTSEQSRNALAVLRMVPYPYVGRLHTVYDSFDSVAQEIYAIGVDESNGTGDGPWTSREIRLWIVILATGFVTDYDDGEAAEEWSRIKGQVREAGGDVMRMWLEFARDVCSLTRCVFGNPFDDVHGLRSHHLTTTPLFIAQVIDDEAAFDRMPVLADALEESGVTDAAVLGHCRRDTVHTKECFVLADILGETQSPPTNS
jgi:hypothetical protein